MCIPRWLMLLLHVRSSAMYHLDTPCSLSRAAQRVPGHALMPCMLRAAVDVGRTLKARSAVIREVHDALHELGVYAPDASSDGRAVLEQ